MKPIAIVRAVYGVFLLVASDTVVETVTGERSRAATTVGCIIGMRHVLQALTLGRTRSRDWVGVGAGIDAIHALSMVALAVFSDRYRRLAALDAAVAGGWAVSRWLSGRNS
jgi:hypothetical protein